MKHLPTLILVLAVAVAWLIIDRQHGGSLVPGAGSTTPDITNISALSAESVRQGRHYLFDVTDHSPEEISSMLMRAERLNREGTSRRQAVDIAMVLHGPDIEIFAKQFDLRASLRWFALMQNR